MTLLEEIKMQPLEPQVLTSVSLCLLYCTTSLLKPTGIAPVFGCANVAPHISQMGIARVEACSFQHIISGFGHSESSHDQSQSKMLWFGIFGK
jgi:hypothetical protein